MVIATSRVIAGPKGESLPQMNADKRADIARLPYAPCRGGSEEKRYRRSRINSFLLAEGKSINADFTSAR
jgi:hypothetical protein